MVKLAIAFSVIFVISLVTLIITLAFMGWAMLLPHPSEGLRVVGSIILHWSWITLPVSVLVAAISGAIVSTIMDGIEAGRTKQT